MLANLKLTEERRTGAQYGEIRCWSVRAGQYTVDKSPLSRDLSRDFIWGGE